MEKTNHFFSLIIEQLQSHGFTLKAIIISLGAMIFPFIFPFAGISLLVLIDFWTSYKAGKAIGVDLFSEGLRNCIRKWTEYLVTIIVCLIVDAILISVMNDFLNFYLFSSIATSVIALTELKSISENFAGVSLLKVIKIASKYFGSKIDGSKKEIAELLEEELNSQKSKAQKGLDQIQKQEENKDKGLKKEV